MNKRLELARWAVQYAQKKGANQVGVSVYNNRDVTIEYRDKQIDKLKESTGNGLSVQIYVDNKYSSHSTNYLEKRELERFISEAIASTKYLAEDKFRALPDPKYYPKNLDLDLKLVDAQYASITPEQRLEIVKTMAEQIQSKESRVVSTSCSFSDNITEKIKIHSNGFEGISNSTFYYCSADISIKDKNSILSGYTSVVHRFFKKLISGGKIGDKAIEDAVGKVGQSKVKSGVYSLLLDNKIAGNLIYRVFEAMFARSIQQKKSYLEGKIGQPVASDLLTLTDDPLIEGGLASRLFDSEGIKAKKRIMIENGVLKQYYIDNYYGKKLNMEPNGGSLSNITFKHGQRPQQEIIKSIKKGILVNHFNGGNSNSTTGDFSFGVSGKLIENGKIVKPVNEMVISGNAKDFWMKLVEVGNNPYPYSSIQSPSLLFDKVDFSGI